jgi:hypothetical protein
MSFTSSTRWGRNLAEFRSRDNREAMYVADAAEQEAMVAKIQREREAHAQGAKDDPEP